MSSQINFYMMPEDVAELEQYIKQQGLLMIGYSNTENKPLILDTIINLNELKAFFILPEFLDMIKMNYYENRNLYIINEFVAPLIEYFKPFYSIEKNIMRTGRLYFEKYLFINNEFVLKDEKTILTANNLLKWYRKHFKNTKINCWHTTFRVSSTMLN